MKVITADQIPVADNPHGVDARHIYVTGDVVVSQITLQPGDRVKAHAAPVDVFFYVLEGAPVVEIEDESVVAAPDMLIPSAAGHVHAVRNEGDAVARVLVVKTPNPRP
jgi:quercetin dioxygenase-like cupin family protein